MRKLSVFVVFIVLFCFIGMAAAAIEDKPIKPTPTVSELQWQLKAIENEFLYLGERQKTLQIQYREIKEQLDKLAPPKAAPAPAPEPKKDEGKKK